MATATNQNKYLTNMAAGKTATGATANTGQQAWAKAELAKVPNPAAAPKAATTPTTPLPKAQPAPAPQLKAKTPVDTAPQGTKAFTPITPKSTVPAPATPAPTSTFTTPAYQDWQTKTNDNYAALESLTQTPFNYDPNTDVGYQAQRELAQLRAGDASRNAMESANEKGLLNSSTTVSQLGQIQQRAEQEAAAYIPEYRQQAYGQYQDRLAAAGNLLNTSRALRGDQFNEAVTEGELLGTYSSPEARNLVSQLIGLKQQAEASGITADARGQLSKRADGIRSQLQSMGIDISKLGADVNSKNVSTSAAGVRTMQGQAQDYSQSADTRNYDRSVLESDRNYDRGVLESDRSYEYTAGRDAESDKQWLDEFNRRIEQDGRDNALAWAAQSLNQQQVGNSANNQAFQQQMAIWEATGQAPAGIAGVEVGTPYSAGAAAAAAKQQSTFTSTQVYNSVTSQYKDLFDGTKTPTTSDWESVYKSVINFGLPESEEYDILRGIGMSAEQIADFDKRLLNSNSGN